MPEFEELIQQLNDTSLYYYRRADAIKSLVRLGDDRAVAPLIGVLGDQEKYVRREALLALSQLGSPEAIAPIAGVLAEDEDDEARRNAARALSEFATPEALAAAQAALEDNSWSVRYAAKNAVKKIEDALPQAEAAPAAGGKLEPPQSEAEPPPVKLPEPSSVDVAPAPSVGSEGSAPPESGPAADVRAAEPIPAPPPSTGAVESTESLSVDPSRSETPVAEDTGTAGETDEGQVELFLEPRLRTGETLQAIAQSSRGKDGGAGRAWLAVTDRRAIIVRPAAGSGAPASAAFEADEHSLGDIAGTEFLDFKGTDGGLCTGLFLLSAGRQPLDAITLGPADRADFEELAEAIESLRGHAIPAAPPPIPTPVRARHVTVQPARAVQSERKAPKLYKPVKPGALSQATQDVPPGPGTRKGPPPLSPGVAKLQSSMAAMRQGASAEPLANVSETASGDKQIRLALARRVYGPGETVVGKVTVSTLTPLPVRGVRLRIRGQEKTSISRGSGKSRTTYHGKHAIIERELTLFGEQKHGLVEDVGDALMTLLGKAQHAELRTGTHPYPLSFVLPPNALPTYSGKNAEVKYEMCAYIDIPAAFDLVHRRSLVVLPPQPLCQAAHGSQGSLDQPDGRIALAASVEETAWKPGATLYGTLSFENPTRRGVRAAIISFVCHEQARAGGGMRTVTSESDTTKTSTRVSLLADEQSVRDREFSLQIPMGPPPFRGEWCQVSWFVEVRLDVPWARDIKLRIPIRTKGG